MEALDNESFMFKGSEWWMDAVDSEVGHENPTKYEYLWMASHSSNAIYGEVPDAQTG